MFIAPLISPKASAPAPRHPPIRMIGIIRISQRIIIAGMLAMAHFSVVEPPPLWAVNVSADYLPSIMRFSKPRGILVAAKLPEPA